MKKFAAFCFMALVLSDLFGQSITGRVVDGATNEPLPFASVYINNSTLGTTTDEKGEFRLPSPPSGNIELIASYVGYTTFTKSLTIAQKDITLTIPLSVDEKQLSEIEVVANKDKAWDAMYARFEKAFLGTTPYAHHSKILNPWVIDVSERESLLTATARAPIEIENKALGYKVIFDLKEFSVSDSSFLILGYSFFSEMVPEKKSDSRRWRKTRGQAYEKSLQNVFLSIIGDTTKRSGLELYKQLPGTFSMQKTQWFYEQELGQRVIVVEPNEFDVQAVENMYSITLPQILEIHFNRISTKQRVYRDVPFEVAWISPNTNKILISDTGLPIDARSISLYGYLANQRVADLMPINYKP